MSFPSVHAVILNWNGLDDTLECLASLRAQNYPAITIHVVDNGSVNDEATIIGQRYPDVAVLRQKENLGFCGGNNVGIKRALATGADFVLILNNDTILPPDCITNLMHAVRQRENLGAASPLIAHYPDVDSIWFAGTVWESQTAGLRVPASGQTRDQQTSTEPYTTNFACGCCLLAPASVWRTIGLFDERYFAYYEEADWSSRVMKAGLECYVIPSATVYHKVTRSTTPVVVTYMMARNRLLWMRDHLSWRERLPSLPYLIKEACWNLCNISLGVYHNRPPLSPTHSKAMLIAWWDFIRGRFGPWPERINRLEGKL